MKAQTRSEAKRKKVELQKKQPSSQIGIYKFAGKRKYQFFIGNWWQWLLQIS